MARILRCYAAMPGEREKMLAGALYDPMDPELVAGRTRARDLCQAAAGNPCRLIRDIAE